MTTKVHFLNTSKFSQIIVLLILSFLYGEFSYGQGFTANGRQSISNGRWNQNNTWQGGVIPGCTTTPCATLTNARLLHTVSIQSNGTVKLDTVFVLGPNGVLDRENGNDNVFVDAVVIVSGGGVINTSNNNGNLQIRKLIVQDGTVNMDRVIVTTDLIVNGGTITGSGTVNGNTIYNGGTFTGNITISQNTTLTNNLIFTGISTLTIAEGVTLNTNGFRILNVNTININGTLQFPNDGGLTGNTTTSVLNNTPTINIGANGTVHYSAITGTQQVTARIYQNLTLTGNGLKNATGNVTVNGTLNLGANPNADRGQLEMVIDYGTYATANIANNTNAVNNLNSHILFMGPGSTTAGSGDVTGRIRRTSIPANTTLTFGNANTSLTFTDLGTRPTEIDVLVTIGSRGLHVSKGDAVRRLYQVLRVGGSEPNTFTLRLAYLPSELNGNTAANLVTWDHHIPYNGVTPHEHGKTSEGGGFIQLSGHGISYLSTRDNVNFTKYWMLSNTINVSEFVWLGAGQGATGSDWTFPSNWSGGRVPSINANNNVIIPNVENTPSSPTLSGSLNARTITIQEGGVLNGGSGTLTLSGGIATDGGLGTWNNSGTFNPSNSRIIFTSPSATIGGSSSSFASIEIANNAIVTPESGSTINISQEIILTGTGTLNAATTNNTVRFNGTGAQTIANNINYHNLTVTSARNGTVTFNNAVYNIAGNLNLNATFSSGGYNIGSSTFNLNGANQTVNSNTPFNNLQFAGTGIKTLTGNNVVNGTLSFTANVTATVPTGSSLTGSGGLTMTTGTLRLGTIGQLLPQLTGAYSLTGGTIELFGTTNNTAQQLRSGITYNNLVLNSNGANSDANFSATGNITNTGNITANNITVRNNCIFMVGSTSTQTITTNGTFLVTGGGARLTIFNESYVVGPGTFRAENFSGIAIGDVNGISPQSCGTGVNCGAIRTTNRTISNDLYALGFVGDVEQNSGTGFPDNIPYIFLIKPENVRLNLTKSVTSTVGVDFYGGILVSSNTNLLTFANGSRPGVFGGSPTDGSFIEGPVRKIGNEAFTFPVGANGLYRPCSISAPAQTTDHFTAQYFNADATIQFIGDFENTINNFSQSEYWQIDRTNGNSEVLVTLNWIPSTIGDINEVDDLIVVRFDGTRWINEGGVAIGDAQSGSITSETIRNFSPFTIGSSTNQNVLPVEMVFFTGKPLDNVVQLIWQTASEINNHFFEIERTVQNRTESLGIVYGQGTTSAATLYNFEDKNPQPGIAYYHLIQTDFDGTTTKYGPVAVNFNGDNSLVLLKQLTTPQGVNLLVGNRPEISLEVQVYNLSGRLLTSKVINPEGETSLIKLANISEKAFLVRVVQQGESFSHKVILAR
ncbi:MAG: beta strand repeat-containing protein [Luteibaculaceae bacterium]